MAFLDQPLSKREFLKGITNVASSMAGISVLTACAREKEDEAEKEVSPPEDLMQEHGVLKRILLIYDTCRLHLMNRTSFPINAIADSAGIVRTFIEEYHEQQEEDYIFPRFKKVNQLVDLVDVLVVQHKAGRKVTDEILAICKTAARTTSGDLRLAELLHMFNTMYSPHEAREDTVLFPAFRKIVSKHEYDSLGEDFEKNEHKKFGEDGFASIVDKVANIEKQLGVYDLAQFTPKI